VAYGTGLLPLGQAECVHGYEPRGGEPRHRPSVCEWPIAVVLAEAALGLGVIVAGRLRVGVVLIAGSLLLGAVLRLLLPDGAAGALALRSRGADAVVLGVLGTVTALLVLLVPPAVIDIPGGR